MQQLKIEASNQAFSNNQESNVPLEYSDDSDFSDDDYYGFEDGMKVFLFNICINP